MSSWLPATESERWSLSFMAYCQWWACKDCGTNLHLHKLPRMHGFKEHMDPFLGMLGSRSRNLLWIDPDTPNI